MSHVTCVRNHLCASEVRREGDLRHPANHAEMTLKRHGFVREKAFGAGKRVHINTLNSEII